MTVVDYLNESVRNYPNNVYVSDENKHLTFLQLQRFAKALGSNIIERSITRKPVVIYMDKSVDVIAAFYGVAYSGNHYVPIDTSMPLHRVELILKKLNPALIITDHANEQKIKGYENQINVGHYSKMICSEILDDKILSIQASVVDTDPLYILFTSGTTGTPKGVVLPHKAIVDFTDQMVKTFNISGKNIFGNKSAFHFDFSVLEIYCAAKTGSEMAIIPDRYFTFPMDLLRYLKDKKITMIAWVPSALCLVADMRALGKVDLPDLKQVFFCGEVMPTKQLNMWRKHYSDVTYVNLYGPTETAVASTFYIVDRDFGDEEDLPIGRAFENTNVLIINDLNEEASVNEIGEICIRGSSLALGYYNDYDLTKEVFVNNPMKMMYHEMIYKTGDVGKFDESGLLRYIGRKDNQIKRFGYRIEMEEIETIVNGHECVKLSCGIYDARKKRLVLFYSSDSPIVELETYVKNNLPAYMIPDSYVHMKEIPLTGNGKIDRKCVKQLYFEKGV